LAKKIKNLSKKIRLAEDLQAKVDAGEVAPSAEQADKLARLEGMRQELAELELQRAQS
jgi:ribosome-binding protein aMBF1 (putative translation factor)